MASAPRRPRLGYAFGVAATIGAGLASRRFPQTVPDFLGKYPGDVLWALMVFLGLGVIFSRAPTLRIAVTALSFSFAIEFLKLSSAASLVAARNSTWGHLVFGHVFAWQNLVAYTVGVGLGVGLERLTFRNARNT